MPRQHARHQLGPGGECSECGQLHRQGVHPQLISCAGHVHYDRATYVPGQDRKRLDKPRPCGQPPAKGLTRCRYHGTGAKNVQAAGRQRAAVKAIRADAEAILASEGIAGIDDPIAMIEQLTLEAHALRRAAASRMNALDEIRYTGGLERDEKGELRGTGTEQLRAEVALYERALDRSMKFLEIVVRHTADRDVDDAKAMLAKLGEHLGIAQ